MSKTPQVKEAPALAYAGADVAAVPLSVRDAWRAEIHRRARASDLGITKSIPAEESDRRVKVAMQRWKQRRGL